MGMIAAQAGQKWVEDQRDTSKNSHAHGESHGDCSVPFLEDVGTDNDNDNDRSYAPRALVLPPRLALHSAAPPSCSANPAPPCHPPTDLFLNFKWVTPHTFRRGPQADDYTATTANVLLSHANSLSSPSPTQTRHAGVAVFTSVPAAPPFIAFHARTPRHSVATPASCLALMPTVIRTGTFLEDVGLSSHPSAVSTFGFVESGLSVPGISRKRRFFVVDRKRRGEGEFKVLGSIWDRREIYTQLLFNKSPLVILFIYLKVLQVTQASALWYQIALLTNELETIFANAPLAPNAQAHPRVREAYARATGKSQAPSTPEESTGPKKRVPGEDDDCPICYDNMHGAAEGSLTFCEECDSAGNKPLRNRALSSLASNAVWPGPAAAGGARGSGARTTYGEYINISNVAGNIMDPEEGSVITVTMNKRMTESHEDDAGAMQPGDMAPRIILVRGSGESAPGLINWEHSHCLPSGHSSMRLNLDGTQNIGSTCRKSHYAPDRCGMHGVRALVEIMRCIGHDLQ
ncbi:hypothetical protein B0H13DRAFT_1934455 [Mycena leptocephala]|nr:hypothetical protein B0H13DRAFT_1934455 [Mycena leptocephala]